MNSTLSHVNSAYIGLGSNLESPREQILLARSEIAQLKEVSEAAFSSLYVSAPMGPQDQPDYVNAVMAVTTSLTPLELLHALQNLELSHGRVRGVQRWGARTLDLDLLIYENLQLSTVELTLPHPGITDRAFVLYPLQECNPDVEIPGKGHISEWIKKLPQNQLHRFSAND